jgi:hypothetical protein
MPLNMKLSFAHSIYLAPPRQVGGFPPRDALGRHPYAGPSRWLTAGGPVAGAQLGIIAGNLRGI